MWLRRGDLLVADGYPDLRARIMRTVGAGTSASMYVAWENHPDPGEVGRVQVIPAMDTVSMPIP